MYLIQIIANFFLFGTGILGIVVNTGNILIVLMSIELVLLSVNMNFLIFSAYIDDCSGFIFSLFILTVAAAESAIGLAIMISFYRIKGKLSIEDLPTLKG